MRAMPVKGWDVNLHYLLLLILLLLCRHLLVHRKISVVNSSMWLLLLLLLSRCHLEVHLVLHIICFFFFFIVYFNMLVVVVWSRKALPTHCAMEFSFFCMRHIVSDKLVIPGKSLRTIVPRASVRLFPSVWPLVGLQMRKFTVCFCTAKVTTAVYFLLAPR